MSEEINHDRRRFVASVSMSLGLVSVGIAGSFVQQATAAGLQLPSEGEMPSLAGATGWLRLAAADSARAARKSRPD